MGKVKRWTLQFLAAAALLAAGALPAAAQNLAVRGWCEAGATPVVTSGLTSTTLAQASYPQCTVTVNITGGGAATIFSDATGTPLANPFTAQTNGQWIFFVASPVVIDVVNSGSGMPAPVTYSSITVSAGGGGGGGGGISNIATAAPITGGPITTFGTIACPTCATSTLAAGQIGFGTSTQALGGDPLLTWDPIGKQLNSGSTSSLNVPVFGTIIPQVAGMQSTAVMNGLSGTQYAIKIMGQATNSTTTSGLYTTTLANGSADSSDFAVEADAYSAPDLTATQGFNGAIITYTANRGPGTVTRLFSIASETDNIGGTTTTNSGFYAFNNFNGGVTHNNYGFESDFQGGTGDTLNAAFYSANQGSGAKDYSFYSAGGKNYFAGPVNTGVPNSSLNSWLQTETVPNHLSSYTIDTVAGAQILNQTQTPGNNQEAIDGELGVNAASPVSIGILGVVGINHATGTSDEAIGVNAAGVLSAAGTVTYLEGLRARVAADPGGTGTITNAVGVRVNGPDFVFATPSSVTNAYGVYVDNQRSNGIPVNTYGLYLESPGSGATDYSLYSAGGHNFFGGAQGTEFGNNLLIDEGTAPSAVAGKGVLYEDSTSHLLNLAVNGGSFLPLLRSSGSAYTIGHCLQVASATALTLVDSGAGCGGGAGGANTALSNLAGVGINTTLLPGASNSVALGSNALAFTNVFLGTVTNQTASFNTAALTANRTITIPNAASTLVVADTGAANNFLTAISTSGAISKAQPTLANIAAGIAGSGTFDFSGVTLFKTRVGAGATASANGDLVDDSTANNWHLWNGVDAIIGAKPTSVTVADNDCVKWTVVGSKVTLNTAGGGCTTSTGANAALSNLAAVAINTALLPGAAGTIPLGSTALPFSNLFVGGTAAKSLSFVTSALTTNRTVTSPDANTVLPIANAGTAGQFLTSLSAGGILGVSALTYSGNTTELATVTGAVTSGHAAGWDASGNLVDAGTAVTSSSTNTFTNKTLDQEGTGNVLTTVVDAWFDAAGCNNATAAPSFDLPAANAPTANCLTGSNTNQGTLDFSDSANQTGQIKFALPHTWTGAIDITLYWLVTASGGSNAVNWTVQTGFTAPAASFDTAFNAAQTITTNVGSNNIVTTSAQSALTLTGSAVDDIMHIKIGRDVTDTFTGTARLLGARLVLRKTGS